MGSIYLYKRASSFCWRKSKEHGAPRKPYEREEENVRIQVEWGDKELTDSTRSYVVVYGISVGSVRYIKAGILLAIRRKEEQVAQKVAEGWPDGAVASLKEKIEALKRVGDQISREPADILWELIPKSEAGGTAAESSSENGAKEWDVFVSHASEDKAGFVRELADGLVEAGLKVWYDEFTLKVGDSLRRSIDRGLENSRYGIVVLSPAFLEKEWPQKELDGLVGLETGGRKVILPVWHRIGAADVRKYSPTLADRVATTSEKGLAQVVADLLDAMGL